MGSFPGLTSEIPLSHSGTLFPTTVCRTSSRGVASPLGGRPVGCWPSLRGRPFPGWGLPSRVSFRPRPGLSAASVQPLAGLWNAWNARGDAGRGEDAGRRLPGWLGGWTHGNEDEANCPKGRRRGPGCAVCPAASLRAQLSPGPQVGGGPVLSHPRRRDPGPESGRGSRSRKRKKVSPGHP